MNDLIGKARETERVQDKLIRAEQGGFSNLTRSEILAKARATLDSDQRFVSREGRSDKT